jgi:hypothetical protein
MLSSNATDPIDAESQPSSNNKMYSNYIFVHTILYTDIMTKLEEKYKYIKLSFVAKGSNFLKIVTLFFPQLQTNIRITTGKRAGEDKLVNAYRL